MHAQIDSICSVSSSIGLSLSGCIVGGDRECDPCGHGGAYRFVYGKYMWENYISKQKWFQLCWSYNSCSIIQFFLVRIRSKIWVEQSKRKYFTEFTIQCENKKNNIKNQVTFCHKNVSIYFTSIYLFYFWSTLVFSSSIQKQI